MRIGILSDSHANTDRIQAALQLLGRENIDAIIHAGDICCEEHVPLLADAAEEAVFVAGNMDRDDEQALAAAAERAGATFSPDFTALTIDADRHLAVTHGHYEKLLEELIAGGQYAYVVHGHTHRRRDERFPGTRVLNPGSVHKPKGPSYPTCLLLDTQTDTVEELVVPD